MVTLENLYFVCQLSSPLLSPAPSNSVGPIKTGNNLTRSPCDSQSTAGLLTDCDYGGLSQLSSSDDGALAAAINNTPGIISTLNIEH